MSRAGTPMRRWFVVVVAVALAVRVAMVVVPDYVLQADPADYHRIAVTLAERNVFPESTIVGHGPTAYRPPGYPVMLAAIYKVVGVDVTAARLVQAVLGTFAVVLLGLIAARIWDRRVALAAMAIAAVHPLLFTISAALMSEALLLPLVLGAVLAALVQRERGGVRFAALAGALSGASILTRVNTAVLLLPLALLVWQRRPRFARASLVPPLVLVAVAVAVVVPWTVRNATSFDRVVPVSTQAGFTLAGTYNEISRTDNPLAPGAWTEWYKVPGHLRLARTAEDEAEAERRINELAVDYAREHPGYVAAVWAHNTARMLHLEGFPGYARFDIGATGMPGRWADAIVIAWFALLPFAVAGALGRRAREAPWPLWLVPLIAFPLFAIVAYLRFRITIEPFVILLAALGASALEARVVPARPGSTR